eukprot:jgi/Mesvir1/22669/Mv14099-RA.1
MATQKGLIKQCVAYDSWQSPGVAAQQDILHKYTAAGLTSGRSFHTRLRNSGSGLGCLGPWQGHVQHVQVQHRFCAVCAPLPLARQFLAAAARSQLQAPSCLTHLLGTVAGYVYTLICGLNGHSKTRASAPPLPPSVSLSCLSSYCVMGVCRFLARVLVPKSFILCAPIHVAYHPSLAHPSFPHLSSPFPQLKCGDLFENRVVDEFNKCAISKGGCVPQKANDGTFRVPSWDAVVPSFSTLDLNGDWYITAGLNPSFDTFDCQRHTFSARQEGKMSIHIRWRTPTIDGGFVTRETDQNFVADPDHPGALYNHDNEFLHYQDDWYIVDAKVDGKPDDYFIVYYKGKNDAWDGYGGATIYTRSKTLPEKYKYNYQVALRRVGVSFDKMIITDNSCPPLQPLPLRLEKVIEKEEMVIAEELTKEEKALLMAVQKEEELLMSKFTEAERRLLGEFEMDARAFVNLFGKDRALRESRDMVMK